MGDFLFTYKIDDEISLKLVDRNDAEDIFQLTVKSRDYLKEWLPWPTYIREVADTKKFIENSMQNYVDNKSLVTAIIFKGEVAGIASFNSFDWTNRIGQIGYFLGEEFQEKGIMTKVVQALMDIGFKEFRLNKIEIRAATENVKSRKIPERLGFTEEGILRQVEWLYDHYVDHVVYGMLKDEWMDLN